MGARKWPNFRDGTAEGTRGAVLAHISTIDQLDRHVTQQLLSGSWADASPSFGDDGFGVLPGAADWRGPDLAKVLSWSRDFTPEHVDEVKCALDNLHKAGIRGTAFSREQFPLQILMREFRTALADLEDGLGLVRLRGFPVEHFSEDELRQIVWGFGLYLGTPRAQDETGALLADVRDLGRRRGYENSRDLGFHSDPCDVTALFCVNVPVRGGTSYIVSSLAIRNEIARTRPDLLRVLHDPIYWHWVGRERPGGKTWCEIPLFARDGSKFVSMYSVQRVNRAISAPEVPDYSPEQKEAVELIAELIARPEFRLSCSFERGDLQLLNNYVTYHGRSEFVDDPSIGRMRHLMRLWLSVEKSRNLPAPYRAIFKETRGGMPRGGYVFPDN